MMLPELSSVRCKAMNNYILYRFLFPFRSRRQDRLREERMDVDVNSFASALTRKGKRHNEIARLLWNAMREVALVSDFRPAPDDSLADLHAMGPEEVLDELIEPLLDQLGLSVEGIDFAGFDFDSVKTPGDIANFMHKVVNAQDVEHKIHINDL